MSKSLSPRLIAAPPGHYMLFLIDGNGVPSVARIIRASGHSPRAEPEERRYSPALTDT